LLPRIDSIKQIRQKIGITQKKLATMTGISTSMINQIESGRSQPSYETAKKIFESLAKLEGESSSHTAQIRFTMQSRKCINHQLVKFQFLITQM